MATIKSFTDLSQSKVLAEILPLESADMYIYKNVFFGALSYFNSTVQIGEYIKLIDKENKAYPCWSLTALLDVLPNEIITDNRFECHYQIHIRKYNGGDNTTLYQIAYGNDRGSSGSWHDMINTGEKDNLVDACYQMIIRLKELKML